MAIERIDKLTDRLDKGAVIAFPTDTTFGLGCSIQCPEAIERVFTIKGRDPDKTVPVLGVESDLRELIELPTTLKPVIRRWWPGPLTLVLDCRKPAEWSSRLVRSGTMAVRDPGFEPLRELLERSGPLVGTSANPSGLEAPARLEEFHPDFLREIDGVVGEEAGGRASSTVAEWNDESGWTIHREGPIDRDQLKEAVDGAVG